MSKEAKNINTVALEYMEQKYGEPFEYVGPWGNSMSGTHELLARCDSLQEPVLVEIENYREDDKVFRDNYIAVKYKQQTADLLQECAESVFGEANVYYEVRKIVMSDGITADATFEDYLADTSGPLAAFIEVKGSSFSDRSEAELIGRSILEHIASFDVMLVAIEDSVYGTLDRDGIKDRITHREFEQCAEIYSTKSEVQVHWMEKE